MTGMEPFLIASALGTGLGALGTIQQTGAQSAIAQANSDAQMRQAGQTRAASEAEAYQIRHKTEVLRSQEQADLAASGGGMGGSGADILAGTAGRGKYNEDMAIWSGDERAKGIEDAAAVTRFAASQNRKALPLRLGAQVLTGVSKVAGAGGFSGFGGGELDDSVTDVDSGDTVSTYRPRAPRYRYVS